MTPINRVLLLAMLAVSGLWFDLLKAQEPAVLRSCHDVISLSPEEADQGLRLELEAVATYFDPNSKMLFIQDNTAGVYVYMENLPDQLDSGQKVQVSGVTGDGIFSPFVYATSLQIMGEGEFPGLNSVGLGSIRLGARESQWVTVEGVVRRDGKDWIHRLFQLNDGDNAVEVRVAKADLGATNTFLNARIRVRGVVSTRLGRGSAVNAATVYCPSPDMVEVLSRPDHEPLEAPLVRLDDLLDWRGGESHEHLVRVRGDLVHNELGQWLSIVSGSHAVTVQHEQTNVVERGTEVEVVGFMSFRDGRWGVSEAIWRSTGVQTPLVPLRLDEALSRTNVGFGEFVRTTGELKYSTSGATGIVRAVFDVENRLIDVLLGPSARQVDLVPGGIYQLSGALLSGPAVGGVSGLFLTLHAMQNDDLSLVRGPASPVSPWYGVLLFGLGVVLGGGALYLWKRGKDRREEHEELESALAYTQSQLSIAERERERISMDLHDNIIQSMYAIGMGIEEAGRTALNAPDQASERLNRSREAMNQMIRDVRQFISGMESTAIKGTELGTAIKSTLLAMGDEASSKVSLDFQPDTLRRLNSKQATELFHIANEAIANSIRHSGASHIGVSISSDANQCRLEISDDGSGFDPDLIPPGKHGLHNMKQRAKQLYGVLLLETASRHGSIIKVSFPLS